MAVIDGDENDNSISSGGIPRGDTLFSSTYGGNDTVSIFSPSYDVHLGEGDDVLSGGIGGFAYGEGGNDNLSASLWEGSHNHYGGDGNDRLTSIFGGTGTTYLASGGAGADLMVNFSAASAGSLSYDGGSGFDVVMHKGSASLVMTSASSGTMGLSTKSYIRMEGIVSDSGDDVLIGGLIGNLLIGGGGNDSISGGAGDDFLIGEGREENFVLAYMGTNINFSPADALDPLNETVSGTYSFDSGGLADTLRGGSGNDVLSGGDGADILDGGLGLDWVSYMSSPVTGSISVNLATGGTLGHAAGDVLISIENAIGSEGNDTIIGTALANDLRGMFNQDSLTGLGGDDSLDGGRGRDTLSGGRGADQMTGGDAEDAFVFEGLGSLGPIDTITDFQVNFDEIWLSAALFRKVGPVGALGADLFHLGTAAHDRTDRLIYDATTGALYFDADGNRTAQSAVQIAQLGTGLALTEGDFLVIA